MTTTERLNGRIISCKCNVYTTFVLRVTAKGLYAMCTNCSRDYRVFPEEVKDA